MPSVVVRMLAVRTSHGTSHVAMSDETCGRESGCRVRVTRDVAVVSCATSIVVRGISRRSGLLVLVEPRPVYRTQWCESVSSMHVTTVPAVSRIGMSLVGVSGFSTVLFAY